MDEDYIRVKLIHGMRNKILKGWVFIPRDSLNDFNTSTCSSGSITVDIELNSIMDTNPRIDTEYETAKVLLNSALYLKFTLSEECIAKARTQLVLGIKPRITLEMEIQYGSKVTSNFFDL